MQRYVLQKNEDTRTTAKDHRVNISVRGINTRAKGRLKCAPGEITVGDF